MKNLKSIVMLLILKLSIVDTFGYLVHDIMLTDILNDFVE